MMPLIFSTVKHPITLEILLQYDVDLDVAWGEVSLLGWTYSVGQDESLKLLLEHGVDPNMIIDGTRPVLKIVLTSRCAKLLLQFGADPRLRDCKGCTPGQDKMWAKELLSDWTPYNMIPVWTFTQKAYYAYSDHCPGFRDGVITLLLCLLRHRSLVCRQLTTKIVAYVAQGHKESQWWPIVGFSIDEYI